MRDLFFPVSSTTPAHPHNIRHSLIPLPRVLSQPVTELLTCFGNGNTLHTDNTNSSSLTKVVFLFFLMKCRAHAAVKWNIVCLDKQMFYFMEDHAAFDGHLWSKLLEI